MVIYHIKLPQGQFDLPTIDFQDGKTVSHKTLWCDLFLIVKGIELPRLGFKAPASSCQIKGVHQLCQEYT